MMDCNVQVLIHASFAHFKMKSLHKPVPSRSSFQGCGLLFLRETNKILHTPYATHTRRLWDDLV